MVLQLSLSPMTMRERLLRYTRPTGSDLKSSSKEKVDYRGPPAVSLQCRCGNAYSVTLTTPGQTRRLSLPVLTAIFVSATLLYPGNTRGQNLKNWVPRTSSVEADIWRAEMQSSENI